MYGLDKRFILFSGDGILDIPDCDKTQTHALLVVGYGPDYFIVQNSWGTDWGDKGYAKIRDVDGQNGGMCGLL